MLKTFAEWINQKNREVILEVIDEIKYPTEESIIFLHDFIIRKLKLDEEEIHEGIISSGVLSFPGVKYYMKKLDDKKEDLILRGANIFNKFLQAGHPFVDGNKRTGFVTLWLFLLVNGMRLKISSLDYKFQTRQITKWAENTFDNTPEISGWIRKNVFT